MMQTPARIKIISIDNINTTKGACVIKDFGPESIYEPSYVFENSKGSLEFTIAGKQLMMPTKQFFKNIRILRLRFNSGEIITHYLEKWDIRKVEYRLLNKDAENEQEIRIIIIFRCTDIRNLLEKLGLTIEQLEIEQLLF